MIRFTGTVYRLNFIGQDTTAPVPSPEGRFHHSGQPAIYTSLTVEGCGVAIKRYLRPDDAPRHIVPLAVDLDRVADIRGQVGASVIWQDSRAAGCPAPTWSYSDQARADGAQGLMYSSRSRPDLTHLTLFTTDPGAVRLAGPPIPFP
ncbi:RES family NAD+ phosphorylase [Aliiroseovarius sp. S2029]|uniref:RES family NAD+ phosphorylase n=1 Tax=Aliiroseovarius sp. S2029 TaxID=2936988 RepID=UPI0020C00998|nr:RES family NAD+ phosphorylase [Aliiroseovarius sp. S2029]MCK8482811.1 RES family NAD+ phosphorylase [Aliiroseovarius sp. S2029]